MDTVIESVVCPGCSCLCDDLDVTLNDGGIVEVTNVCLWGASKFFTTPKFHPQKERRRLFHPQVRRRGKAAEVAYEAALGQAAEILTRARRPLVYGLTNLGSRAQEAALKLAQSLGARLLPGDHALMAPYFRRLQQQGLYWAPLEVIRDEADTVLFWGVNPLHSAPRHVVRYAAFARGRFTERGLEDRRVAAVDLYRNELARFCHLFIKVAPDQELVLLQGLMEILFQGRKSATRVRGTRRLADLLARAGYGVIFFGRGVSYSRGPEILDGLAELTACLGARTPFVLFPLSGDFNAAGLYHLLLRELGSAEAPDFAAAAGEGVGAKAVDFRDADALLVAGADLFWFLPEEQREDLQRRQVPIVALSPFANHTTVKAQVILPVALAGVEAADVAYRLDGLPLGLKKLLPAACPPDHQVLRDLQLFF